MDKSQPPLDARFMEEALELARRSRPSPNPQVGAVVVSAGRVVGRGHHERPGMPHAEIVAIEQAGDAARGADLYVTLEPCCHQGRTGPCSTAIVSAGVARVGAGMVDPDPRVSGKGIAALKEQGVAVEIGLAGERCQRLLEAYTFHRNTGRPLVTLKAATTLDGMIATASGDSKWISSERSRQLAHRMRSDADAVVVGIDTVLADDPALTVRLCPGESPTRVVLDSQLRTPQESQLIQSSEQTPVILAHTAAAITTTDSFGNRPGLELLRCASTPEGRVDPADLVAKLGARGTLSLLVEGGGRVHGAFAQARVAQRVALFVAPKILGSGRPWIVFPGSATISDALCLAEITATGVGEDQLIEGRLQSAFDSLSS